MTTIRAYRRHHDGTLEIVDILEDDDGTPCDGAGYPLVDQHKTVGLLGWLDSSARLYTTDGGVEILVPVMVMD